MADAIPRKTDPDPSTSSESQQQNVPTIEFVAPPRKNADDSSDDDIPGVTIDDDDSSYTLSPQKFVVFGPNGGPMASKSVSNTSNATASVSDPNAFVLPQSLMPTEPVSAREAEYLIQNAHMAYAAAEKASNCRIHEEASGSNCESMMRDIQGLRTYVTKLQNQQREIRLENTQALKEKMDIEAKYEELKLQYTAILEQGLNAKSAADEAKKWRDDYEKSQAVLLEFINTYSGLREKYNESVKLASAFAEERDLARNDCYDEHIKRKRIKTDMRVHVGNIADTISVLTDFIEKQGLELPDDIEAKVKEAKLDVVAGLAIANRKSLSPSPPPSVPINPRRNRNASSRNVADESDSEIGAEEAMERALAGLRSEVRSPSPTFDVPPAPQPKRRVAHRADPAVVASPRSSGRNRRMSDDEVSVASSTSSRRSARLAKKPFTPASTAPPPRGRGRGGRGRGRGRGGHLNNDDGPDSRPDMPPPPLPATRGRKRGGAIAQKAATPEKSLADVLANELMTSDDDYSVMDSPPKMQSPMASPTKSIASSNDPFEDMPSSSTASTRGRGRRGRGNTSTVQTRSRKSSTMTTPASSPVKSIAVATAQDLMDELMTSDDNSSTLSSPVKAPSKPASPTKSMQAVGDDSFDDFPTMDAFDPPEPMPSTSASQIVDVSSTKKLKSTLQADLEMSDSDDDSASATVNETVSTSAGQSKAVDVVAQDLQLSDSDDDSSVAASPIKSPPKKVSESKAVASTADNKTVDITSETTVRATETESEPTLVPNGPAETVKTSQPATVDSTVNSTDVTASGSIPRPALLPIAKSPPVKKPEDVAEKWMPTSPPPKTVPPTLPIVSSPPPPQLSTSTSTAATTESHITARPTSLPIAESSLLKDTNVPEKYMPTSPPPKTALPAPLPAVPPVIIPPKPTVGRTIPPSGPRAIQPTKPASKPQKIPEKPAQQADTSDDFFMDILSAAKTAPTKPKAPVKKRPAPVDAPIVAKPVEASVETEEATVDDAAPKEPVKAKAKTARPSSPLKPRTIGGTTQPKTSASTRKAAANRAPLVHVPVTAAPLSEPSSDEEDVPTTSAQKVPPKAPPPSVPSTSKSALSSEPSTVPSTSRPSIRSVLAGRNSAKAVQPAVRGGRSGGVRAMAVTALPPIAVPTSVTTSTEGTYAPSIHGRKTMSIREQQKRERRPETLAMLNAEREKLNSIKPLPKKPTCSQTSKKPSVTTSVTSSSADKIAPVEEADRPTSSHTSKTIETTEEAVSADSAQPEPSTSTFVPPVRLTRVAHVPAPGSGIRANIAKGKSMAQVMNSMTRQAKQRLAGTAPKTRAAPPAVSADGAPVPKKRGRKSNAEKAAIAAAEAAKKANEPEEATEEVAEPAPEPTPVPKTRAQKRSKPEASPVPTSSTLPKAKKQKTAEEEPPPTRQLRPRGRSSTTVAQPATSASEAARRIFNRVLVGSAEMSEHEIVESSIDKMSADELSEIALECALKIDQKDLFASFETPEYTGEAVLSEQEERFFQLISDLGQNVTGLTRKLFMLLAKKQLQSTDRMPPLLVNRNYRLIFVLMQFIDAEEGDGLSSQEKSMVDKLLDNLVLQRAPTAVASTLCYLILIDNDTMKRYLTNRVVEDSLGYGELLTIVVNECPTYTETLSMLITDKTEIDYASSRLSQPLSTEDYEFVLRARLGEAYFKQNGLNEFDMDGELILSISPDVQRISTIVAAMFSPEVMTDFNRKAFLRAGFQLIQKLIRQWTAPSPDFNDAFYDDLTQAALCPDDFDPTQENSVANAVQLMYTFARVLSIPFRRLPKSSIPIPLKSVIMDLLTELRNLLKEVSVGLKDGAVKQKLTFGIKDAVDHLTMSTK